MTNEKTTRELVYETNRDVKWICKMLARMEAQDEEFESRIRALERLSGREEVIDGERRGRGGDRGGAQACGVRREVRALSYPDRPESQHHSESHKPSPNINSSCATSSPAAPGSSAQTLQIP